MLETEFLLKLKSLLHYYKSCRDMSDNAFENYLSNREKGGFLTPTDSNKFKVVSKLSQEQYDAAESIIDCVEEFFAQNNQY